MQIHINPGSGPIPHATEANADANMNAFKADLRERGIDTGEELRRRSDLDSDGRYGYELRTAEGHYAEVEMPGLPTDQVRWLGPKQDIWQYPRLYVDGNSWIWFFALNQFRNNGLDAPSPNDTVAGGEPYRFETVQLTGDARSDGGAQ